MKFLSKNPESEILKENLVYSSNAGRKNEKIRKRLIHEQYGFCAYSEQFIGRTDSVDVEHFNPALKDKEDNYFNYYAVISYCNRHKQHRYQSFKKAAFFTSLFFQTLQTLLERIRYVHDKLRLGGIFEPVDPEDQDARDFISYLGWNEHDLYEARKRHLKRLRKTFKDANYSSEEQINYFKELAYELSYITVLESEFDLNLMPLILANQAQSTQSGDE